MPAATWNRLASSMETTMSVLAYGGVIRTVRKLSSPGSVRSKVKAELLTCNLDPELGKPALLELPALSVDIVRVLFIAYVRMFIDQGLTHQIKVRQWYDSLFLGQILILNAKR